jgi:hypothetical protein
MFIALSSIALCLHAIRPRCSNPAANLAAKQQLASVQRYSFKGNGGVRKGTVLLENLSEYVAEIQGNMSW